jgi:hypothetical protein
VELLLYLFNSTHNCAIIEAFMVTAMKKCLICGLLFVTVVEPTAACFAYHKQSDSFHIATATPTFLPHKPYPEMEIELHPHNHPEDKSPFGVNETGVVAIGTAPGTITKALSYTVDTLIREPVNERMVNG